LERGEPAVFNAVLDDDAGAADGVAADGVEAVGETASEGAGVRALRGAPDLAGEELDLGGRIGGAEDARVLESAVDDDVVGASLRCEGEQKSCGDEQCRWTHEDPLFTSSGC